MFLQRIKNGKGKTYTVSKIFKETKLEKKDEMLGLLNAYVFHLQTHCTLLNNDLSEINSWKELEKK